MQQSIFSPDDCIVACASTSPSHKAIIRISGKDAASLAQKAGLNIHHSWQTESSSWQIANSKIPCEILFAQAPHSFTGFDCIEVAIPGASCVIEQCLQHCHQLGIQAAGPGAFCRQALANKRLHLNQAEAILALTQASDIQSSKDALERLRGALSQDVEIMRQHIIELRAQVESGLDFLDEEDVRAYDPQVLQATLNDLEQLMYKWQRAAVSVGTHPQVCLVGSANAGKSALFKALSGAEVLISDQAGTTRDFLQDDWDCHGRSVRLIDTAGWLDQNSAIHNIDQEAIKKGRDFINQAQLVIACSAADAPLPDNIEDELKHIPHVICATKSDLGHIDPRASLAVSANTGEGLTALREYIAEQLGLSASGEPRQQRCLQAVAVILKTLQEQLPPDELLSDDLRQIADHLGDIIGITSTDDIMEVIFSRFCIGK